MHRISRPLPVRVRIKAVTPDGPILEGSPLAASEVGYAGDVGTLNGVDVVDVLRTDAGDLHVLRTGMWLQPGDDCTIAVDDRRVELLKRTHAACVLTRMLLAVRSIETYEIEIMAGRAWIEVGDPCEAPLSVREAIVRDLPIESWITGPRSRMVKIDEQLTATADRPTVCSTGRIGFVDISVRTSLYGRHSAVDVRLLDRFRRPEQ